jgi:hypothetical protein
MMMTLDEVEDLLLHVIVTVDYLYPVDLEFSSGYSLVKLSLGVVSGLKFEPSINYKRTECANLL